MKNIFLKIIVFFLMFSLNWWIFLGIGNTSAYFSDGEESAGNVFKAGTLDMSAESLGSFSPRLNSNNNTVKNILIGNQGSLKFKYLAESGNFSGNLCNFLNVKAKSKGDLKYEGSLVNLSSDISELASSTESVNWNFKVYLQSSDQDLSGMACDFDFVFKSWQSDVGNYNPDKYFSDIEIIGAKVETADLPEADVVLNEVLPNPEGDDDQDGIQGEWVEFYNNGDSSVDMTGWYVEDAADYVRGVVSASTTYNGQTTIGPNDSSSRWLVLYVNGLNNGGDTVKLYNAQDELQDSYTYGTSSNDDDSDSNNTPSGDNDNPAGDETGGNEGKSYACIPDGSGNWIDPIPTPGASNLLEVSSADISSDTDTSNNDGDNNDNKNNKDSVNSQNKLEEKEEDDKSKKQEKTEKDSDKNTGSEDFEDSSGAEESFVKDQGDKNNDDENKDEEQSLVDNESNSKKDTKEETGITIKEEFEMEEGNKGNNIKSEKNENEKEENDNQLKDKKDKTDDVKSEDNDKDKPDNELNDNSEESEDQSKKKDENKDGKENKGKLNDDLDNNLNEDDNNE